MDLFKKIQRINNLYFEYDELLIIYNYGKIINLEMDLFETDRIKVSGCDFFIKYFDSCEIRIKGKIDYICIKYDLKKET